jgi:hypothetical protein
MTRAQSHDIIAVLFPSGNPVFSLAAAAVEREKSLLLWQMAGALLTKHNFFAFFECDRRPRPAKGNMRGKRKKI